MKNDAFGNSEEPGNKETIVFGGASHPGREVVSSFTAGHLDAQQGEVVERHLESCVLCSGTMDLIWVGKRPLPH